MARATFGGGIADFVTQSIGGGIVKLAPATLSFYSAKGGGTQYTDLLVGGSAAATVSVGSDGQVPQFQGPDGIYAMWADGGGSRVQVVALGDAVALATAPTDTTVAAVVNNPTSATATALSGSYAKTGISQKPQFGGATFGDTTTSNRIPVKSSQGINSAQSGAGNHVAHLFQAIVTGGGWATDAPPDPGYVWGTNFFTTTGTATGDADGVNALYGGLIEADVRAPAGSNLGTVLGLQAEAAFQSPTAGAHVTKMISMQVTAPSRKDGATAGTADTAIGLLVKSVAAGVAGSTTTYTMLVEGGGAGSRFESTITAQLPGTGATADTMTLTSGASQTGVLLRFRDSSNGSVGRVTTGGLHIMFGRGVFCETRTQMIQLGDVHPTDSTKAAITFGNTATPDVVLYREKAGVLRLQNQQVIATGSGTTAQRPTIANVVIGANYFDTTLSKPIWSDGTNWRDAAGTAV